MICFITITLTCQRRSKRQMWRWVCGIECLWWLFSGLFLLAGIFLLGQLLKVSKLANSLSCIQFIRQGGGGGGRQRWRGGETSREGLELQACGATRPQWSPGSAPSLAGWPGTGHWATLGSCSLLPNGEKKTALSQKLLGLDWLTLVKHLHGAYFVPDAAVSEVK